jgi:hypothetical protein
MSGGHFNYVQFNFRDAAEEIDSLIKNNDSTETDKHGWPISYEIPDDIIERMKEASHTIKQASEMLQRVDWYISGDDGEESFHRRWKEEVRDYYKK